MRKNSLSIEGERFFEKYGREDSPSLDSEFQS
jgi:hypothetical protein